MFISKRLFRSSVNVFSLNSLLLRNYVFNISKFLRCLFCSEYNVSWWIFHGSRQEFQLDQIVGRVVLVLFDIAHFLPFSSLIESCLWKFWSVTMAFSVHSFNSSQIFFMYFRAIILYTARVGFLLSVDKSTHLLKKSHCQILIVSVALKSTFLIDKITLNLCCMVSVWHVLSCHFTLNYLAFKFMFLFLCLQNWYILMLFSPV